MALDIDVIVAAFAPVFAAAVAVQKFLEIIDPAIDGLTALFPSENQAGRKRIFTGLVAFGLGIAASTGIDLGVLATLRTGRAASPSGIVDVLATALIIAGGTEATNSILKFLGYAKEARKAEVESAQRAAAPASLPAAAPAGPAAVVVKS